MRSNKRNSSAYKAKWPVDFACLNYKNEVKETVTCDNSLPNSLILWTFDINGNKSN